MSDSIILVLCNFVEYLGAGGCWPGELELLDCILKGFLLQSAMVYACGTREVVLDGLLANEARLLQLYDTLVVDLRILSISLYLCLAAIGRCAIRAELLE